MSDTPYNPWPHRVAVLTAGVALLPIAVGAVVTTKRAGMAFPDWPTSDSYGMFSYPWLASAGDKFLEHGHRLAGIVIGIASIALCVSFVAAERRRWVKALALFALLAVIAQGLLGGFRVVRNADDAALVHGCGAALVFSLLACAAVVTGRGWRTLPAAGLPANGPRLLSLAVAASVAVFAQHVLGGLLRHKGMVLYEHVGFAFVAAALVIWLAISAAASGVVWLRAPAATAALLTVAQLGLGAAAWVTKFGFGDSVAVRDSVPAVAFSSLHVLTGTLLFGACVSLALRIARVHWCRTTVPGAHRDREPVTATGALSGGVR